MKIQIRRLLASQQNLTILLFLILCLLLLVSLLTDSSRFSSHSGAARRLQLEQTAEDPQERVREEEQDKQHDILKEDNNSININISELVKGPLFLTSSSDILVNYIKKKLIPPAPAGAEIILSKPIHDGQVGQVKEVVKYFNEKKGGFFIEAGAWDGEYLSNTLYLEANLSWTGLLVEPNAGAFSLLKTRNRRANLINSCLSVKEYPEEIEFDAADVLGGIINLENQKDIIGKMRNGVPVNMRSQYKVQCFPIYSILLALGNPRVDFFSLDIEGAELPVLQTIPWDKVDIQSFLIEVEHSDSGAITDLLTEQGYKEEAKFGKQDILYVKK